MGQFNFFGGEREAEVVGVVVFFGTLAKGVRKRMV